jgi:hypothetical protein
MITAGIPQPYPPPPAKASALKIGLAHVADARDDRIAGSVNGANIMVGTDLNEYIERKFGTELVEAGYAPIEVLNPVTTSQPAEIKTALVTIQSVSIINLDTMLSQPTASVNIAVQIYGPGSRKIIFAQSYNGKHIECLGFGSPLGMRCGEFIAQPPMKRSEMLFRTRLSSRLSDEFSPPVNDSCADTPFCSTRLCHRDPRL